MTAKKIPPGARLAGHRNGRLTVCHSSVLNANSLTANPQLHAADFKPGFHLEAGEFKSDRYVGKARRRLGDLPTPDLVRGADNRKTCRAARPVYGGTPALEINRGQWHEWIPALTYLEQNGRSLCPQLSES